MVLLLRNAMLTLAACAVLLLAGEPASAVVVAIKDAPKDDNISPPAANSFRDFPGGDWYTDDTLKASDGNEFMGFFIPLGEGNGQDGYAWDLEKTKYDDALGHPLTDGNVVRVSNWLATDPSDPLTTNGTFTDSFKFEFAAVSYGCGSGGCEYFDTGDVYPQDFTPNSTNPQVFSTGWTQVSYQYQIDTLDFSGLLDDLLTVRPVLFIGEYNSDTNNGTLFVDRIIVEVFEDLATANATPLDSTYPGGYIPVAGLAGDYNENGTIDAADYTTWRDAMTAGSTTLMNDPTPGTVDETDFTYWRDHFGEMLGSGAGSGAAATVPEPGYLLLLLMAGTGITLFERRR